MTCQTPTQQQSHLETSTSGQSQGSQQSRDVFDALYIHACLTCILRAASACLRTLAKASVSKKMLGSQQPLLCGSWELCRYAMRKCRSRAVCGKQREPADSEF